MPLGQGHEGCHDCFEVGLDQRQSVAHLQHEGGIDDVLRGRALVEAPFQLLREPPLHGFDERNGRDARQSRAVAQSSEVEAPRPGLQRSRLRVVQAQVRSAPLPAPGRPQRAAWRQDGARSENTARIASVANSGPRRSESRAENVIDLPL